MDGYTFTSLNIVMSSQFSRERGWKSKKKENFTIHVNIVVHYLESVGRSFVCFVGGGGGILPERKESTLRKFTTAFVHQDEYCVPFQLIKPVKSCKWAATRHDSIFT